MNFGISGVCCIIIGLSFIYAIRSAFVKFHLADYFWTRKYRGNQKKRANNDENIDEDLLQRTDTQTILRKIVDDSVPTPKAKDFEAVTNKITSNPQQVIGIKKKKKKRKR